MRRAMNILRIDEPVSPGGDADSPVDPGAAGPSAAAPAAPADQPDAELARLIAAGS